MLYTMIANTTVANPTCQNVTFPAESTVLDITPTADGGQVSQNGFVNQVCVLLLGVTWMLMLSMISAMRYRLSQGMGLLPLF